MLLNRLDLIGFKSFPKRTRIKFSPGITIVVGPNGCGKSNIADAVRWSLGEQNVRHLRGKSLSDVIFKGTREVKPSGMAEVVLHLDNQDQRLATEYADVAIQRRAFRSGESEFRINKAPCRLKDIRSLFLDTGLGSAEYSVIERSMIDEVLADRDDARRFMIDETAGITRYKQRRKETLRKIAAVENDLTRVEDVLEIEERQVRSLAYQMGKARRYKRLSDRIEALDVALARLEWQALIDAASGESGRLREEEKEKSRLSSLLHEKEAAQETKRLDLLELGQKLAQSRDQLTEADSNLSINREETLVRKERLHHLTEKITELSDRVAASEKAREDAEISLAALQPQIETYSTELGAKREIANIAEQEWSAADEALREARGQLAQRQQIHIEQVKIRSDTSHKTQVFEDRISDFARRVETTGQKIDALSERSGLLGGEIEQVTERRDSLDRDREELIDQIDSLEDQRLEAQEREGNQRQQINLLADEMARGESRLILLQEQAKSFEGFREGIVQILAHRDEIPGVIGAAAELLNIDPDWVHRLSPVLREVTDWIVTESEQAAWGAIEWLRGRDLGQVTFVPLQELAAAIGDNRSQGLPDSVITPRQAELTPLADHLRQMIIPIKESADIAPIAERPGGKRWITEKGEVFSAEGWISSAGGSSPDEQLWSRPQEIEALQDQLAKLGQERQSLEQELGRISALLDEVGGQMTSRQNELKECATSLENLTRTLVQKQAEERLLSEEVERLTADHHQLEQQRVDAIADLEASRQDEVAAQQAAGSADELYKEIQQKVSDLDADRDRLSERHADLRMEAMVAETKLKEVQSEGDRQQSEISEKSEFISSATENREAASAEIVTTKDRIAELIELEGDLASKRESFSEKVDGLFHERGRKEDELGEIEQHLRDNRRILTELEESLRHDEVQLARAEADRQRLRDRIMDQYSIDIEQLPPLTGSTAEEAEHAVTEAIASAGETAGAADDTDTDSAAGETDASANAAEAAMRDAAAALHGKAKKKGSKAAKENPLEGLTEEEAKQKLDGLRRDRDRLGPVNQLAIEEYERKREHVKFVKEQKDDLLQSRDSLLAAIERINTEAGRLFEETFAKVQENFAETFSTLFPGGEAKLRLAGDDPLEADIEIMARPRGKRLESIHLLSSGEKALTATSLVFALYLIKPSPFCLLDEVDAPLDDANIDRFLALLRKFCDRTQFIVITHNKRTMEVGDTLYGVTMQEPGISKIVSVKMEGGELVEEDAGDDAEAAKVPLEEPMPESTPVVGP